MLSLNEGLHIGDLEDLVRKRVSVDEFESKIQSDAIVVAFFVEDEDPAWDLSKFIEKSAIDILDADKSLAPSQSGDYAVFVEFVRNKDFVKNFEQLLKALEDLTKIQLDDWKVKLYKVEKPFKYDREKIKKYLRTEKSEQDQINEFFSESFLDKVELSEKFLQLGKRGQDLHFEIISLGPKINITEKQDVSFRSYTQENNIQRFLGMNWNITTLQDNSFILERNGSDLKLHVKKRG